MTIGEPSRLNSELRFVLKTVQARVRCPSRGIPAATAAAICIGRFPPPPLAARPAATCPRCGNYAVLSNTCR